MSPNSRFRNLNLAALAAAALLGLSACMTNDSLKDAPVTPVTQVAPDKKDSLKDVPVAQVAPDKAFVLALTSDYTTTGSFSAFGIDSDFTRKDIEPINSDAVVRYLGGDDIYILNRFGRDNLQVVDRHKLTTVGQIPFPTLSNPYDIAEKDGLLYVGFYGSYAKIGVYSLKTLAMVDSIDLSAQADTVDHFPETTELLVIGNTLYALLGNMNNTTYQPLQARLARIDLATKSVTAVDLPFGQPVSLAYDADANKLYIPCRGAFFKPGSFTNLELDGGIVSVRLSDFKVADTLATEAGLKGSLGKAFLNDGRLIMDLTTATDEKIESISLKDGKSEDWASIKSYDLSGMDIDGKNDILYVGDRTNGLRFFDLKTGKEKDGSKVKLGGVPITSLAVIR